MFKGLRFGLTLIYFVAALLFMLLIGGGSYILLNAYFHTTTDLALQHKMADEFQRLREPMPQELAAADWDQYTSHNPFVSNNAESSHDVSPNKGDNSGGEGEQPKGGPISEEAESEEAFDGELAAIFTLPLNANGKLVLGGNNASLPFTPDASAVSAALAHGHDLRTVQLASGTRVRLLTYRLSANGSPALLQLGRTLADQDRVLDRLLSGFAALSGVSAVLVGLASWWLAGRALKPAHKAYLQQQTFVANASHELRTPLTLARASAEVALHSIPAGDTDTRELLGDVLHECDHMSRLVDDLLLLSRLDAGRFTAERTPIDMSTLLSDVQRQVARVATERAVELQTEEIHGMACGDETRLRQVLLIVLDNALRHTPAGGKITMSAVPHEHLVTIHIADTGCGVAPEHLPHIFERFYRVDSARGTGGGAGLGLALAQALMRSQHGGISIQSTPTVGTQVMLTLPAAHTHEVGATSHHPRSTREP